MNLKIQNLRLTLDYLTIRLLNEWTARLPQQQSVISVVLLARSVISAKAGIPLPLRHSCMGKHPIPHSYLFNGRTRCVPTFHFNTSTLSISFRLQY